MTEQKKILIVDDDPDFVEGIKAILDQAQYNVDVAYNSKDGLQKLRTLNYDMLLLDIMMGRGAEGIMIARTMKKDSKLREIPVLSSQVSAAVAFMPGEPVHPRFIAIDELVENPSSQVCFSKVSTY
jgi:CheY-like chemotaxis protein